MDRNDDAAADELQAILWPRQEDYPRFVAVSTDSPVPTYAEFVARAQPHVGALRAKGFDIRIVEPDVEHMAAWCRANFGQVDTTARAAYAAYIVLNEPTDKDSVN